MGMNREEAQRVADAARAEGYAWGRQDAARDALPDDDIAGRVAARDSDAARRFGEAYASHREAYRADRIGMAHSVASAYDIFVRGETLPTTAEYAAALRRAAPELSDSFGHRINPVG